MHKSFKAGSYIITLVAKLYHNFMIYDVPSPFEIKKSHARLWPLILESKFFFHTALQMLNSNLYEIWKLICSDKQEVTFKHIKISQVTNLIHNSFAGQKTKDLKLLYIS